MPYETIARAVQQGGTLYFIVVFLAGCAYALWPKKRAEFQQAANIPLEEDA